MFIIEKIKAHEQKILSGKVSDDLKICPQCDGMCESFKIHDYRDRLFLVITEGFVKKIRSFLARLKCPLCNISFTNYPDFAIPRKRYVADNILELSRKYLENDETTYQDVVCDSDIQIVYENDKNIIDERRLERSTVWRWLSFVGSLNHILNNALNLIRQKSPTSSIFRKMYLPHPQKYRSEKRRRILQQSMKLFTALDEFRNLFKISIFPDFATSYLKS